MSSLFQILLWTAALSLIAFFLVRHQRLQSIPGPFLASFTDLWRAYRQNFGDFSSILVQLHDKYGSIVRLGPNTVSVSDSAAVAKIYSMHGEFKKVCFLTLCALYVSYLCRRTPINLYEPL